MDIRVIYIQSSSVKQSTTNKDVYNKNILDIKDNLINKKTRNNWSCSYHRRADYQASCYSSVYAAEAIAILEAIKIAAKKTVKS